MVARRIGEQRVVLTGGCFQNKYLTERAVKRLRSEDFRPYWHRQIPPNDGGIAVGQIVAAARRRLGDQEHVPGSSGKTLEYSGC
jgi:hydrogenase maturation protein HypF